MAIAYKASLGYGNSTYSATLTQSLDAGTDPDRVVIVYAATEWPGPDASTGATYGGVSMTAGTEFTVSGVRYRLFWLTGAASGANNIVVTYNNTTVRKFILAAAYSGVSAVSGEVTGSASSSSASLSISSASGSLGVAFFSGGAGSGSTASAADTETKQFDANTSGVAHVHGYIFDQASTGSSVSVGCSFTAGSTDWAGAGVSLAPVAAGVTIGVLSHHYSSLQGS